jgi:hypothetical protein
MTSCVRCTLTNASLTCGPRSRTERWGKGGCWTSAEPSSHCGPPIMTCFESLMSLENGLDGLRGGAWVDGGGGPRCVAGMTLS